MREEDHTREKPQYSSNLQVGEDATDIQMKTLFDMFQSFDKHQLEKAQAEWILQNPTFKFPSKIINSKNITFTRFISYEDIFSIRNLHRISCNFQQNVKVSGI